MAELYVGASGWSYPSWRPDFYPQELRPEEFLGFYAQRFRTVELNTTGYRLPAEEQFSRWAAQVPEGFRFAPKLQAYRLDRVGMFSERVLRLGDRLGPVRVLVHHARDEGLLSLLLGTIDPAIQVALDFRHPSWEGVALDERSIGVGDLEGLAPFRYLRFRDPPYDEEALARSAEEVRRVLAGGADVYCFFRHEDAPTAPAHAARLRELVGD
jgi:uncharacterized protein YecE (DUF72 family)